MSKTKQNQSDSDISEEKQPFVKNAYKKWTVQENALYALFLTQFESDFASEWIRRSRKVYNRMASLILSKSANQCKSHHYKMIKHNGNFKKIIKKCLINRQHDLIRKKLLKKYFEDQFGNIKVEPEEIYVKFLKIEDITKKQSHETDYPDKSCSSLS